MNNLSTISGGREFVAEQLINSTLVAFVVVADNWGIVNYNKGFTRLVGRTDNLTGVDLRSLLVPDSRKLFSADLANLPVLLRLNFSLSGQDVISLQCSLCRHQDGYLIYGEQAMLADSDVMRAMSTMNNEMAALTRELSRKNRDLQVVRDKLQSRSEEIEQFTSIVAHDFSSPLITVTSFLAQLEEDIAQGSSTGIAADLVYIKGAVRKMELLLQALEDITRVGRTDNPAVSITVGKIVEECLTSLAGPLQQRKIKVVLKNIPQRLLGDPLQLGQIWQNLVENALKYMGDQPQPEVEIGVEGGPGTPVFYVRDNGIGIKPEYAERVFWIFTQLDKSNPGSGLGLALVKKIVSTCQGQIWVESAGLGQGSCFRFTLPGAIIDDGDTL